MAETDAALYMHELGPDSVAAEQPSHVSDVALKPHQLTLLHRCRELEADTVQLANGSTLRTRIGVIGDKVGAGKSFVILALMSPSPPMPAPPIAQSYGAAYVMVSKPDEAEYTNTSLLVVPHGIAAQWAEFVRVFYKPSSGVRVALVNNHRSLTSILTEQVADYDVIVVTTSMYNGFVRTVTSRGTRFRRVIFDEADVVSIPGCARPMASFFWFVTASYDNLVFPKGVSRYDEQHRCWMYLAAGVRNARFVKDVWTSLMGMPNAYMRALIARNNDDFVDQSLQLPDFKETVVLCRAPMHVRLLNGIVSRSILDRLNAGDTEGALKCISSGHKGTEDSIIHVLVDKLERDRGNLVMHLDMVERMGFDTEEARTEERERLTAKLQDLQNKIRSIEERVRDSDMCLICYEPHRNKSVMPCCSNSFCLMCISNWLSRDAVCPMCKHRGLAIKDLHVVCDDQQLAGAQEPEVADTTTIVHENNNKQVNLMNLIRCIRTDDPGHRFLICSGYDMTLSTVAEVLDKVGLQYAFLKGNSNRIRCLVHRYKHEDNLQALLINVTDFGSGLNLENTTDVIIMHKLDDEMRKQVIGRAQRTGRTQRLRVWQLAHENEAVQPRVR